MVYARRVTMAELQEQDVDSIMVAVHELAHLVLGLDDAYGRSEAIYQDGQVTPCPDPDDPQCQTRFINTAPHPISLMTYKTITSSPHLDGFHKIQLGWATPRIVIEPGNYTLFDVRQGRQVYILPRYGTDAREYILLETRYRGRRYRRSSCTIFRSETRGLPSIT